MADDCTQCTAKCCRYFSFEIEKPVTYVDFENIRWYLLHRDVSVHVDDGDWYIAIANPCVKLTGSNRCGEYPNRPHICRIYSSDNCDNTPGAYEYQREFKSAEELDAFARDFLGQEDFNRERAKDRKAQRKPVKLARKRK